MQCMFHSKRD
uniref:Uncharacterized protein n=1 Tax=Arundo donax TaxID=35708 RepID=A0A0A9HDN7_ARUDO